MDATSELTVSGPMTIEEFEHLPDEAARLELVRGYVVREPLAGFEHGGIGVQIASCLHTFVRQHGLGKIVGAETGPRIWRSRSSRRRTRYPRSRGRCSIT